MDIQGPITADGAINVGGIVLSTVLTIGSVLITARWAANQGAKSTQEAAERALTNALEAERLERQHDRVEALRALLVELQVNARIAGRHSVMWLGVPFVVEALSYAQRYLTTLPSSVVDQVLTAGIAIHRYNAVALALPTAQRDSVSQMRNELSVLVDELAPLLANAIEALATQLEINASSKDRQNAVGLSRAHGPSDIDG